MKRKILGRMKRIGAGTLVLSFMTGCGVSNGNNTTMVGTEAATDIVSDTSSENQEVEIQEAENVTSPEEKTDTNPYSHYEYLMMNLDYSANLEDWIGFNLPAQFKGYYNNGYFDYDEGYEFCYWTNFGGSSVLCVTDDTKVSMIGDSEHELKSNKSDFENDPALIWRSSVSTPWGNADIYSTCEYGDGKKSVEYYAETAFIEDRGLTLYFSTKGTNSGDILNEAWISYLNTTDDVYLGILEEMIPYMFSPLDFQKEYQPSSRDDYSYYITERETPEKQIDRWYPVEFSETMGFNVPSGFVLCDQIEGRKKQGGRSYYMVSEEINEKLQDPSFNWFNAEGRTGVNVDFLIFDPIIAPLSGKKIMDCSIDDYMAFYQCQKEAEIDTAYGKVKIYYEPDEYETIEHAIVDLGTCWCDIQYAVKPTSGFNADYDYVYNIPEYSGTIETIVIQMLGE